jgi:GT2 family glycosyltransferase
VREATASEESNVPDVTIVIPNLNSPVIDRTLDAIRGQDFDLSSVQVLVVGLDEPGLVRRDRLVRLVETEGPASPAVARNIGIRQSKSEIICLTDADCVPSAEWLSRITHPIVNGNAKVVGGGVRFDVHGYWTLSDNISWFHDYLTTSGPGDRVILPTLNLCIQRDVIDRVGLLDESYPSAAGEDAEWTTRMRLAGERLRFCPEAWVTHAPPARAGLGPVWRHSYRYGRYSVKLNPTPVYAGVGALVLRSWLLLLLLLPAVSLGATARIFLAQAALWRYAYAFPGIWLTKVAWILGAVRTLRGHERMERE